MTATSAKSTELKDRTLWYDGDSTVSEGYVIDAVSKGKSIDGLFVETLNANIRQYNSLVAPGQELRVKEAVRAPELDYTIPKEYSNLNVEEFVSSRLSLELKMRNFTPEMRGLRIDRTTQELLLYEKLDLFDILRTLIFVINTLQDKNIVWGVGRGSSVASYVLYLIGVHDVDSVEYDLDIREFLRS